MLTNELYDILSKIQRFLPALGVFYLALALRLLRCLVQRALRARLLPDYGSVTYFTA